MAKKPEKKPAKKTPSKKEVSKTTAKKTPAKKTPAKKTTKKTETKKSPSATRTKSDLKTKAKTVAKRIAEYDAKNLTAATLDNFASDCLYNYGTYVVEDRAVAEFRDGLKPVHRALMWAMYELGLHRAGAKFKKSARVVGDTLGKYHPHGDSACYNAAVTLANAPVSAIDGQGNWGTPVDSAAAMRYTECRVSKYASTFMLDSRYLRLVPMEPNYDGTERLPLFLPALLPTLLVLGSARQPAFGVSVGTPAFEIEGITKLVTKGLRGDEITDSDCIKNLKPIYSYGCEELTPAADFAKLIKTGHGHLVVRPIIKTDLKRKVIYINSYCPEFASQTTVTKKMNTISSYDGVSIVGSGSQHDEDCVVEVVCKRGVSESAFFDLAEKIQKTLTAKDSFELGFIFRRSSTTTTFHKTGYAKYLNNWCVYRRGLEKDLVNLLIEDVNKELARLERLIFAVNNREIIIRALDNKDPDAFLVKKLKKSPEYIKLILDLQVRKLAKLELKDLNAEVKKNKTELKSLKADLKNVGERAAKETETLLKKFLKS